MSDLSIDGLRVDLAGKTILDGILLRARAGEMLVLAGPSGSGKSTLLRAIAGLAPIVAGAITLGSRQIDRLTPGQRRLAMVFQDHALLPHLSVADNLAFGLRARGLSRAEALSRGRSVADRLGLTPLLSRKPAALSGGECQRVALGRAMLRDAQLVLMDEPLSSLDAPLRARMRREILELHRRENWTTIYVTHDQAEALAMADQLGIIGGGKLLQCGPPLALYERPASLAVARFIGSPPINLLPVARTAAGGVRLLGCELKLPGRDPGAELVVGIRAEAVHMAGSRWAPAGASELRFEGVVERVEHVGDQQFVEMRVADQRIVVRQEPDRQLRDGDRLVLSFAAEQLRWFCAGTGEALE